MNYDEDAVRDDFAKRILGFDDGEKDVLQGTGQLRKFNKLGFKGEMKAPDGWYFPKNNTLPAIVLETKGTSESLYDKKLEDKIHEDIDIVRKKYRDVIGILYNVDDLRVFKNHEEITAEISEKLENKSYYIKLFTNKTIDRERIYILTKRINDNLHVNFGIKNLNHRMIFTACALVAIKEDLKLHADDSEDFDSFKIKIKNKILSINAPNMDLKMLADEFMKIAFAFPKKKEPLEKFIECVKEIALFINYDNWNGEDVMALFFREFNRYKKKSEAGQIFTPEHAADFMYDILEINSDDVVCDFTCGCGTFLITAMYRMIEEAGGINAEKAQEIMSTQLYGIEFDSEVYSLACANFLLHKNYNMHLKFFDMRTDEACEYIKSLGEPDENGNATTKAPTKIEMNPPYERKYGCMKIVYNTLESIPNNVDCGFILPDKKLEKDYKDKKFGNKVLKNNTLTKIIKMPENLFFGVGITTSFFIFKTGIPQFHKGGESEWIYTCYMEDDGLVTVKNQGRLDNNNRWNDIKKKWLSIIKHQVTNIEGETYKGDFIKNPLERISYLMPQKEFAITEEDFIKTAMDYLMFEKGKDVKDFGNNLLNAVLYSCDVQAKGNDVIIKLAGVNHENN